MNTLYALLLSLIAGISTVLGSIFILFKIKRVEEFITFSLSFSMGIMIIISIFDLLPRSVVTLIDNYKLFYGLIICFLVFLLGYLSVYMIETKINKLQDNSSLYKIGIISMITLVLHNLPEGMAVFMSSYSNIRIGIKICSAIVLHNIPEGIAISVPLYYSGQKKSRVVLTTLISGFSEPLGALLSYLLLKNFINNVLLSFVLIFVSGLMISLSINDIFKEIKRYNKLKYIIYGLIVSVIISILLTMI